MKNSWPIEFWSLYKSPEDFPGEFVVRRYELHRDGKTRPGGITARSKSRQEAQDNGIPKMAICLGRTPDDVKSLVATWIW